MSEQRPVFDSADYPLYTVAQVTEALGVNAPTLRRWERDGLIAPSRTSGGQRRYTRAQLHQLRQIAELAQQGVAAAGIRKALQLQQRIDQLEEQLATRDNANQAAEAANQPPPIAE
jgi:MerR family transcriptional regulator, heat shock protein HspR